MVVLLLEVVRFGWCHDDEPRDMVNETTLIVAGTLAALCGLVWYLGVRRAIRSVGRLGGFGAGWTARIIVLMLILGMGTLIFGLLILRTLSALVTGTE